MLNVWRSGLTLNSDLVNSRHQARGDLCCLVVSDVLLMCYDKGDDCFCAEAHQNPNGIIHSDTLFVAVVIKYLDVKFCFLFTFCLI